MRIKISEKGPISREKVRECFRERKMRTNVFCTNFLNTARGPGHPGKNPGTSQIPPFETQGRQTFEGGHEVFGYHPFAQKIPTPPGGLRTQKVNLCALFSCLNVFENSAERGQIVVFFFGGGGGLASCCGTLKKKIQ